MIQLNESLLAAEVQYTISLEMGLRMGHFQNPVICNQMKSGKMLTP